MNNLRNIRRQKNISLAEISKETEIPIRTLEMWDSNKRIPQSYHRIKALAGFLEVGMDELMEYWKPGCIYDGKTVEVSMQTVEKDTLLQLFEVTEDEFTLYLSEYITRESAMDLFEQLKIDKNITDFMNNRIQFYEG